jgi:hypothetical protein
VNRTLLLRTAIGVEHDVFVIRHRAPVHRRDRRAASDVKRGGTGWNALSLDPLMGLGVGRRVAHEDAL